LIFFFLNEDINVSSYCSGKAAYGLLKDMAANPAKWKGRKILFVRTGGLLDLYDKVDQLSSLAGSWRRMELEESAP
jgi:D-cysteine desulfhydrase